MSGIFSSRMWPAVLCLALMMVSFVASGPPPPLEKKDVTNPDAKDKGVVVLTSYSGDPSSLPVLRKCEHQSCILANLVKNPDLGYCLGRLPKDQYPQEIPEEDCTCSSYDVSVAEHCSEALKIAIEGKIMAGITDPSDSLIFNALKLALCPWNLDDNRCVSQVDTWLSGVNDITQIDSIRQFCLCKSELVQRVRGTENECVVMVTGVPWQDTAIQACGRMIDYLLNVEVDSLCSSIRRISQCTWGGKGNTPEQSA